MNYVEFINKNERIEVISSDNDFPNELKKILENKENEIIEVSVDNFIIIENYSWILKYDNNDWIDEYCKRLKKHEGIRF